jgi:hypothetical protein
MKRSSLSIPAAFWIAAVPAPGFADMQSAATCAASLTADQNLIYQSVLPYLTPETDLPSLVRTEVMALVSAGRLSMSTAPDDARKAGRCLQMVYP